MKPTPALVTALAVLVIVAAGACEVRSPVAPGSDEAFIRETANRVDFEARGAADGRVTLCHASGNGRYQPITISSAAAPAHRAHGDAAPGEPVPGLSGMVFDEACAPLFPSAALTGGSWILDFHRLEPLAEFTVEGPELRVQGRWGTAEALGVCRTCLPGQTVTVRAVFHNPEPTTLRAHTWAYTAVVNGAAYSNIELGGPLIFEGGTVVIPDAPGGAPGSSQSTTVTTTFVLSGQLKGYEVLGRREPLLVFDVPVSGRGTATLELVGHGGGTTWSLYRVRFDFAG
jgi:hypothetical protein